MSDFKSDFEVSKKDNIEHVTQVKILRQIINEKNENIHMLSEEVENWIYQLEMEKKAHFNTTETLTALEIKLHKERTKGLTLKEENNNNNY